MYRWLGWGVVQVSGCVGGVGLYKRLGGWRECISWPGGVYRCTGWVERDVCRCLGRLDGEGGVYRCAGRMGAVVCRCIGRCIHLRSCFWMALLSGHARCVQAYRLVDGCAYRCIGG